MAAWGRGPGSGCAGFGGPASGPGVEVLCICGRRPNRRRDQADAGDTDERTSDACPPSKG